MKKSQHKFYILSALTLALATIVLLASFGAHAAVVNTGYQVEAICLSEQGDRIKLFVDGASVCSHSKGPFRAQILMDMPDQIDHAEFDSELTSARVTYLPNGTTQYVSRLVSDDGKSSEVTTLTMPSGTPAKDAKGTMTVVTSGAGAEKPFTEAITCNLIERMYDCGGHR